MSTGNFQNVNVTDTTNTNNISCNNLVCNNTALMTSFSTPSVTTSNIVNASTISITAPTINIGDSTSNVTIQGTTTYANVTNLDVKDPLIRLNKSGTNAIGAGIEIEESGSIISSLKLDSNKDFTITSPNNKLSANEVVVVNTLNSRGNTSIGTTAVNTLTVNATANFNSGISISSGSATLNDVNATNISASGTITATGAVTGSNLNANANTLNYRILPHSDGIVYMQTGVNSVSGSNAPLFSGDWSKTNTTSTRKLAFDGSGNLGIGTATPSQRLHVYGSALISNGDLLINSDNISTNNLRITSGYKGATATNNYVTYDIPATGTHYFWDNVETTGNIIAGGGLAFPSAISNLSSPFKIVTQSFTVGTIGPGATIVSSVTLGYTFSSIANMWCFATPRSGTYVSSCYCAIEPASTSTVTLRTTCNTASVSATSIVINLMVVGII